MTGALPIDGASAVTLANGQNARFTFTAQANTGYGLAVTGLAFTPSVGSPSLSMALRKADGTTLVTCSGPSVSCDFDPANFATAGTYIIDFDPSGLVSASFTAVLSADATGTLSLDAASPTQVATARPGQNARYSFAGTVGQALTVVFTGNAFDDGNPSTLNNTQVVVVQPSGASVGSTSLTTLPTTLDVVLPQTGTYTLVIKPLGLDSGSTSVQLKSLATGTLVLDGSTPMSLGGGQNGRFSFTAQANTGYGLAITNLAFTPSSGSPQLTVRLSKLGGPQLKTCPFTSANSCDLDPALFATAGTYLVDFDPSDVAAATFTVVLSSDASGTVATDAAPALVTIARPGQNARYRFAGSTGQSVSVVLTDSTLDDGNAATPSNTQVVVVAPSGSTIAATSFTAFNGGVAVDTALAQTGNYTIVIKPSRLDAGSFHLAVRSVATGALAIDDSTTINLGSGQNGRFSFAAEAGTGYGLALTNLVMTPNTAIPDPAVAVRLLKPDGTELTTCSFSTSGSCDLPRTVFATAGTYVLELDPSGTIAASFNAVLSADLGGTITNDAPPLAVSIARGGQNARYSFAGTAGQALKVVVTGSSLDDGNAATVNIAQFAVFKPSSPDASPLASAGLSTGASGTTISFTLPETGTYFVTINPVALDSGSLNLGVAHQ
jgi:hypothetical protein